MFIHSRAQYKEIKDKEINGHQNKVDLIQILKNENNEKN